MPDHLEPAGDVVGHFCHIGGDLAQIDAPDAPMEALRSLFAGKPARAARKSSAPSKPRGGTKQEHVLAMLRRPDGATVAQIAKVMGWAQHMVRGFFARLKKRAMRPR